ncbi:sugar transferase [Microbacterium xylanilyticum]
MAAFGMPRIEGLLPRIGITPHVAPAIERRNQWQRHYRRLLVLADLAVVLFAAGAAAWIQIASIAQVDVIYLQDSPWQYFRVFVLTCAIWLVLLALCQTRDIKVIGHGTTEYRRVIQATALAFGVLAIGFILLQSQGIRTQLLIDVPVGIPALLIGRWLARRWLVRQRQTGEYVSRALVVGGLDEVEYVVNAVRGSGLAGYQVVGVTLVGDQAHGIMDGGRLIRAYGTVDTVAQVAQRLGADAVIVASTLRSDPDYVKRLAWQLEGTAAELVLSSPLADVAGPRMSLKAIEGLPLIQVEIPTFEGGRYALKRTMDVAIAFTALIGVALVFPFIALAIKIDSAGPIFFRQERVGRDGQMFRMVKFRSMGVDAEARKAELQSQNEGSGPLFKLKADPRVTRVGAFLSKYSLDELPQFWNVLIGDMSAVGPRPPLPSEVVTYDGTVRRRLYIKPGITGLWQISGRSDLSWEDSVRLDLRYVENWSVTNDLLIIWRTARVMIAPEGAY